MIAAFVVGLLVGYSEGKRRGYARGWRRGWITGNVDTAVAIKRWGKHIRAGGLPTYDPALDTWGSPTP